MKTTMRDKICQLIGKYQFFEEYFHNNAFFKTSIARDPVRFCCKPEESSQADMCGQFLADLNKLLEEDEAVATQDDPRKTAPAGKLCAESAAQAAERVAKEARNNG